MPRRGYKLIEPAGGQEFAGRFFVDKKIYVYISQDMLIVQGYMNYQKAAE